MCKHKVDRLHQRYILKFIQFLSWVFDLGGQHNSTGCSATVTVSQFTCAAHTASLVPGARDPGLACLAAGTGPHRLPEAIGPAVNTFPKFFV